MWLLTTGSKLETLTGLNKWTSDLKVLCLKDIAVQGQVCAEVMITSCSAFTAIHNNYYAPVELWSKQIKQISSGTTNHTSSETQGQIMGARFKFDLFISISSLLYIMTGQKSYAFVTII